MCFDYSRIIITPVVEIMKYDKIFKVHDTLQKNLA